MKDFSITPDEAPQLLAKLVGEFLSATADFSDIPVLPEKLNVVERKAFEYLVKEAAEGRADVVFESVSETEAERDYLTRSFELDYLLGKILFHHGSYYEASKYFEKALMRFEGYGELWFLAGMANYVMGAWGRAFMQWHEAVRVNENHKDARLVVNLANTMMKNTHRHLNPEAEPMLPIVSGRGIDVGCGAAKTSPGAIGVDLIAPGEKGTEASQKDKVSQADIRASGDDLFMFADGELDYVIARHNLEHYADPARTLREWARVLKTGGVLGLVLPDDETFDTLRADATHKSAFTQGSLRSLVSVIPDLAIVEQGTCQNAWSIYLIAEKVRPGGRPSYDYRRRLSEMIADYALQRAQLALAVGLNDNAAAALRKAKELAPDTELPADPGALHPFPFPGAEPYYVSRERGGLRIALACGHPFSFEWLGALERMGNSVIEIPAAEAGGVNWTAELALRDFKPDVFLAPSYDFKIASRMALMGIPYASWEYGRRRGDIEWRRDLLNDTTLVFASSPSELERYKRRGAKNLHILPPGIDTSRWRRGEKRKESEREVLFVDRPEWKSRYPELLDNIKSALMSRETSVERKNALLVWLRRFDMIIRRQLDAYGEWIIPGLWEDVAEVSPPIDIGDYTAGDIQSILGEEAAERTVSKNVIGTNTHALKQTIQWFDKKGKPMGEPEVITDPWRFHNPAAYVNDYFDARINQAIDIACPWDAVPIRTLEIMACGGFALAERRAAYDGVLREGDDFACYSTPEEAREKARYYLDNPDEREKVAESGYKTVIERHSLEKRFERIFDTLRSSGVLKT